MVALYVIGADNFQSFLESITEILVSVFVLNICQKVKEIDEKILVLGVYRHPSFKFWDLSLLVGPSLSQISSSLKLLLFAILFQELHYGVLPPKRSSLAYFLIERDHRPSTLWLVIALERRMSSSVEYV